MVSGIRRWRVPHQRSAPHHPRAAPPPPGHDGRGSRAPGCASRNSPPKSWYWWTSRSRKSRMVPAGRKNPSSNTARNMITNWREIHVLFLGIAVDHERQQEHILKLWFTEDAGDKLPGGTPRRGRRRDRRFRSPGAAGRKRSAQAGNSRPTSSASTTGSLVKRRVRPGKRISEPSCSRK